MSIRVPFDPDYTSLIGTAVYIFAYYEWAVIYLIEQFRPGFVAQYCRGAPMTSGRVHKNLESILGDPAAVYSAVSRVELERACGRFAKLIEKRNALVHAHPITDTDGSQILNYQAS